MRFALLGDHVDGLAMARALVDSGRHELPIYCGPAAGRDLLARWGMQPRCVGDFEEALADPRIEAVIVAGSSTARSGQLRRALQSRHHVLCVHPAASSLDVAYEAELIQQDVHCVLLPLLPEILHPGLRRLTGGPWRMVQEGQGRRNPPLVEMERWSTEEILAGTGEGEDRVSFPGWDILRLLGGEIGELFALGETEEVTGKNPILITGQFVKGGLFQATLLPFQGENRLRVALVSAAGRSELLFPEGWPGPARLTYPDETGQNCSESWDTSNPWPAMVETFEAAAGKQGDKGMEGKDSSLVHPVTLSPGQIITWQDALRGLELDDAARRSLLRRRASTLEYQEATEEASFKGTMTLVGCGILWLSLILLILSVWVPWLGWLILPVFGVFLAMQVLRWVVPKQNTNGPAG